MDLLIEDLLKYVRIENHELSFDDVNCDRLLKQVMANLHAAIKENDAEITSDPLPTIRANGIQMTQLFQNLIENAIKYASADAPRIHISADNQRDTWEFTFRDNGIGIDSKYQDKIFDVFQRLHSNEVIPGTGIGLATCKAIVDHHGGRIWVHSEKGKGSCFHFTIPHSPDKSTS
jgi:light-regulated signal transduction histidine kinase (bacteriophytochrome)